MYMPPSFFSPTLDCGAVDRYPEDASSNFVQNDEKCEKRGRWPSFLTTSRCFETVVKHYFEFFIWLFKRISI